MKDSDNDLTHCFYLRPTWKLSNSNDSILKKAKLIDLIRLRDFFGCLKFMNIDLLVEYYFLRFGITLTNTFDIICVTEQPTDKKCFVKEKDWRPIINWEFSEDFKNSVNKCFDYFIEFIDPYCEGKNIFEHRFDRLWSAAHISGTCRMSSNKDEAVVNENFRYKSIRNLYVCDGSILPKIGHSNTGLLIKTMAQLLSKNFNAQKCKINSEPPLN